jgi:hypothetical protein
MKICFKLVGFSKFPTYFYMKILINYDYNMNFFLTHWYILVLYPFESKKKSITIVLSSYFQIFEAGACHLLSCTYISKNVPKCILKHEILQYYVVKSKIFLLLIIKIKNINEFNVLSLSLWILSTQKISIPHWHTFPCFQPNVRV